MRFYEDMVIKCVNPNNRYLWPSPRDMACAELVSRHVVLTDIQLEKLGYPSKKLSKMVKHGVLYRYEVTSPTKKLPSIYTAGNTARLVGKLPVPRFPNMEVVRSLLLINQVMINILQQVQAEIDVNPRRPVQFAKIKNPIALLVAKDKDFVLLPLRFNANQAIVILPESSMAASGFPFRYVLEEEIQEDSFELNYYYKNETSLVPVKVTFGEPELQDNNDLAIPAYS